MRLCWSAYADDCISLCLGSNATVIILALVAFFAIYVWKRRPG